MVYGGQIPKLPQRACFLLPHLSTLSMKNSNSDIVELLKDVKDCSL